MALSEYGVGQATIRYFGRPLLGAPIAALTILPKRSMALSSKSSISLGCSARLSCGCGGPPSLEKFRSGLSGVRAIGAACFSPVSSIGNGLRKTSFPNHDLPLQGDARCEGAKPTVPDLGPRARGWWRSGGWQFCRLRPVSVPSSLARLRPGGDLEVKSKTGPVFLRSFKARLAPRVARRARCLSAYVWSRDPCLDHRRANVSSVGE